MAPLSRASRLPLALAVTLGLCAPLVAAPAQAAGAPSGDAPAPSDAAHAAQGTTSGTSQVPSAQLGTDNAPATTATPTAVRVETAPQPRATSTPPPEERAAVPMAPSSMRSASGLYLPLIPASLDTKNAWGGYRLTSPRGPRCMPTNGATTEHLGQDIATKNGAPIYAVAGGKVLKTKDGTSANSGYIVIESKIGSKTYQVAYIHMWNADAFVKVGQTVKAGQQISTVGSSGPSTGPHLHLEVWNGAFMQQDANVMGTPRALNPVSFLAGQGLNIAAKASLVSNPKVPSSCTYYARANGVVRAGANDTSAVLASYEVGDTLTSRPGAMMNQRLQVTYKGKTGYMAWNAASPFYVAPAITTQAGLAGRVSTATNNVNLRASAVNGAVRTIVGLGHAVKATGRVVSKGAWREVTYAKPGGGSFTGWISSSYLKDAAAPPAKPSTPKPPAKPTPPKPSTPKPPAKPSTPKPPAKPSTPKPAAVSTQKGLAGRVSTATTGIKLRASAVTGAVRAVLPKGAKVTATGRIASKGSWREVKYAPSGKSARTGWVASSYLKDQAAKPSVPSKPGTTSKKPAAKKVKKTTANVWMRTAAVKGKGVLVVKKGTKLTLASGTKKVGKVTWYKVTLGKRTGWVSGSYLR